MEAHANLQMVLNVSLSSDMCKWHSVDDPLIRLQNPIRCVFVDIQALSALKPRVYMLEEGGGNIFLKGLRYLK